MAPNTDVSYWNTGDRGCTPETGCGGAVNVGTPGTVLREYWENVPGPNYPGRTDTVDSLTSNLVTAFPDRPTSTDQLPSLQTHAPHEPLVTFGWADQYGERVRGFIKAPETGIYLFWLGADNGAQLWLSDSTNRFRAKPIAVVFDYGTNMAEAPISTFLIGGQRSGSIALEKDKLYYFDLFHKEAGGDDYCEVRWTKPSDMFGKEGKAYEIVPSSALVSAVPITVGSPGGAGGGGGVGSAN